MWIPNKILNQDWFVVPLKRGTKLEVFAGTGLSPDRYLDFFFARLR